MDKKDDIEALIQKYMTFYQQDSQKIKFDQNSDFDSLMTQYKTKFDKQIADEQRAMREKENARIQKKKQELELRTKQKKEQVTKNKRRLESLKNKKTIKNNVDNNVDHLFQQPDKSEFNRKYQQSKNQRSSNLRPAVIITVIVVIILGFIYMGSLNNEKNNFFSDETDLSTQLNNASRDDVLASKADYIDNIGDKTNLLQALPYLNYIDNGDDYFDLINIFIDYDDFLMTDNNTSYYLYLSYSYSNIEKNLLISPANSYYDIISNNDDLVINRIAFYEYNYQLPKELTGIYIETNNQIYSGYLTDYNAQEIFKYYYYRSSLEEHSNGHNNDIVFIQDQDSTKGYYGYLDYVNRQINIYYSNDIDKQISVDNIQDYQHEFIQTITL